MKRNNLLIIFVFFISTLFLIPSVIALTASSPNYSVEKFITGLVVANASSDNYVALSLLEPLGATRNAESDIYTSNIGFFDNTPYYRTVSITSYSVYPKNTIQGSIIRLSVSALNSENVWAVLTLPDSTQEIINMNNNENSYYTADLIGQYNVVFYANNSQGNIASIIDTFKIISTITPPVFPPPTGAVTSTTVAKCEYIWDCGSWSICSNGTQKRECNNIGNCTGIEGKPIEARECSDELFDVIMKLNEIEITPNKTLKFDVNLTETKGIEKTDVQIKYAIINSNNSEVFSQIETRAIRGNLTYEKEISEINLEEGDYILRIDIVYGNLQRAFAEQKFKVEKEKIETEKQTLNIKKEIEFLKANYIIIFIIILFVLMSIIYIKENKSKKEKFKIVHLKKKQKPLANVKIIGGETYLEIKPKPQENIKKKKEAPIFRASIFSGLKEFIYSIIEKHKKYTKNSIRGLINKKIYSDSGYYVGKVKDITLRANRIEGLNIELDKKYNFKEKGILVNYRQIKSINEVIIIDKEVLDKINEKTSSFTNQNL
jgi:sporulation protein YlmC with PRC-barrel domain